MTRRRKSALTAGERWLKIHALQRWIAQMDQEGPDPAPTPALRPIFAARHAARVDWARKQIKGLPR